MSARTTTSNAHMKMGFPHSVYEISRTLKPGRPQTAKESEYGTSVVGMAKAGMLSHSSLSTWKVIDVIEPRLSRMLVTQLPRLKTFP